MHYTKTLTILILSVILFSGCSRLRTALTPSPTATTNALTDSNGTTNGNVGTNTIASPSDTVTLPQTGNGEKGGLSSAKQSDYISESVSQGLAKEGPTVYFFKANWCPTCKQAQSDLNANIGDLPAGTTIVTVDYDKATQLKQKYGVTYQHTWVQIDAAGTVLSQWNGGGVNEIVKNLKG